MDFLCGDYLSLVAYIFFEMRAIIYAVVKIKKKNMHESFLE